MRKGLFSNEAVRPSNERWRQCIRREIPIYLRDKDIRSHFARDYNRIIHSTAYRRLKHKTQVFFATKNDHICTRMEHVNHVTSVSYTIAKYLGLNTELTNAIAVGHDLGHAPFGHAGEVILAEIAESHLNRTFWHEMNSLHFADNVETLPDQNGIHRNLMLTYAVRDGIVCHCGEVDEKAIFPRKMKNTFALEKLRKPGQHSPYTWEGCIVKLADKVAYLGRDIEDAIELKILTITQAKELVKITRRYSQEKVRELTNTMIMHDFIIDLCENSDPENGIRISEKAFELMKSLKDFSKNNIYYHERLNKYREYAKLILNSIFDILSELYRGKKTLSEVKRCSNLYPVLTQTFAEWLLKYSYSERRDTNKFENKFLYDLKKERDFHLSILDFISGMTDNFAIRLFNEITSF